MERHKKTSKFIALALRHQPQAAGISLDEHGWADADALCRGAGISRRVLEEIVATDEKQRYSFSADGRMIRANQGHSIPVDLELTELAPPELLYHGTVGKFLPSIWQHGLQRQSRQYVHLSPDPETAVKVGQRRGRPAVLLVHAGRMRRDGFAFYRSENGVWLTKEVPAAYLEENDTFSRADPPAP